MVGLMPGHKNISDITVARRRQGMDAARASMVTKGSQYMQKVRS